MQEVVRTILRTYDGLVNQSDRIRARIALTLRAERAFGVTSLPIRRQVDGLPVVAPVITAPSIIPATQTTSPQSTNLFGNQSPPPRAAPSAAPLHLAQAFAGPELSRDQKLAQLTALNENEVRDCKKCRLCETRTNTVFGEGDSDAKIFFIGEGPGENEDLQGRPFVGRAGELLNKWITAMGLRRDQVFIANIVKCRPPGNREPAPDETATCTPYLERQLDIIRPRVIITLGRPSSQYMLQTKISMGKMRGQWHAWRSIKLMPTYHPAYVLRNYTYETRAAVWNDLQMVMKELDLPLPKRGATQQS
jgi:uracil-DNA glycosylase